jgi:4-amino-4-deoxy-L-arabinose transferase-like glycosyltransferase
VTDEPVAGDEAERGGPTPPDAEARQAAPDRLTPILEATTVTLVALAAFTWRLLPDVGFWDTAIFQAAPPTLGLTHPTGYPTFNLLGWLWTSLLPLGSAAYEMNLLTAVAGALAVGMMYVLARRLGAGRLAAAATVLACALMVVFWRTSERADPHPLHVLLALVVVALLLAWDAGRRPRTLALAALVFGLGVGNHMLMALLAPGIGIYVVTARPSVLREPRTIVASILALAAGLAVYAYVPIRGAANPAIHYDYAPTTLDLFLRYVLGRDFSGQMGFFSLNGPGTALGQLPTFWQQFSDAFTVPVAIALVVLAAVGFGWLLTRRAWRTAWLLGASGGITLYARLTYQNGDLERYALLPVAILGILAAVGLHRTYLAIVRDRHGEPVSAGHRAGHLGVTLVRVLPALALAVPLVLFVHNQDRVRGADARCYVTELTAGAPADAAIVSWWSMATPLWYAQAVEGARPDLTVVSAGSTVVEEIGRFQAAGRPVVIIQLDGEVKLARDAGFPMEEVRYCGVTAYRITGPAGTAPVPSVP